MHTRLLGWTEQLRSSLWAIPAVSTLVSALLGLALIDVDRGLGAQDSSLPWVFHGGANSAQVVLSTIAGSMVTVAGTVYSLIFVALTLASVQFAPRVLHGFLRDRRNQVVLGFFVATFTYCLIVLRSIRSVQGQPEFVPALAVTGGVVLALVSLAMLIYFINHIFHNVQVSSIIANVAARTRQEIDRLYPEEWREGDAEQPDMPDLEDVAGPDRWMPVLSRRSGYLQFIDYQGLYKCATRAGAVIKVDRPAGAFLTAGAPLAFISPPSALSPELQAQIENAFLLGSHPSMLQDIAFGIRQIVDIAVKAISPAVNDPTTAVNCIDQLGAMLAKLATRNMPPLDRADATGQVRLVIRERTFHDLVRLAFDQIRHYGSADPIVVIRLVDTLVQISWSARNPAYREVLLAYLDRIATSAESRISELQERQVILERVREARVHMDPSAPVSIRKGA